MIPILFRRWAFGPCLMINCSFVCELVGHAVWFQILFRRLVFWACLMIPVIFRRWASGPCLMIPNICSQVSFWGLLDDPIFSCASRRKINSVLRCQTHLLNTLLFYLNNKGHARSLYGPHTRNPKPSGSWQDIARACEFVRLFESPLKCVLA